MLGDQDAIVLDVRPLSIHGLPYVDVTVAFRDRSVHEARLGTESVPADLQKGETVLASVVANMVVSLRRP